MHPETLEQLSSTLHTAVLNQREIGFKGSLSSDEEESDTLDSRDDSDRMSGFGWVPVDSEDTFH